MNITTLGIDIAKNVFQLHGVNEKGIKVLSKKLTRKKLLSFIANLPKCLIGMEACGGANHWARMFVKFGHNVKLMSPQFVKPYVKSNKNDKNDAEAICEAVTRPNMRFVSVKTLRQQDIQSIHRVRSKLIQERTALANQTRGLLAEYGIVLPQNIANIRKMLPEILENAENDLTFLARELFQDLYFELKEKDEKIKKYDVKIETICNETETCKTVREIEGIGVLTATALISTIGDASIFKNGREISAWIGLVPKQFSSGGKERLAGISKRGNKYLRQLLIHGARAVIYRCKNKTDAKSKWLINLIERKGMNKATVALANKNARIAWALMTQNTKYKVAA